MRVPVRSSPLVALALAAVALVPARAAGPAPGDDAVVETALVALEKQSWDAWQRRDGGFYDHFLSADHVEVYGSGTADKQEVVEFVGSDACVVESWSVGAMTFRRLAADVAVLTYPAEQKTVCHGRPVPSPAWVTSVYVRRDGRGQNAVYQQTPRPPAH